MSASPATIAPSTFQPADVLGRWAEPEFLGEVSNACLKRTQPSVRLESYYDFENLGFVAKVVNHCRKNVWDERKADDEDYSRRLYDERYHLVSEEFYRRYTASLTSLRRADIEVIMKSIDQIYDSLEAALPLLPPKPVLGEPPLDPKGCCKIPGYYLG